MGEICRRNDAIPQLSDMLCALQAAGVDTSPYKWMTIPADDEHQFDYWTSLDGQGDFSRYVSTDVIISTRLITACFHTFAR